MEDKGDYKGGNDMKTDLKLWKEYMDEINSINEEIKKRNEERSLESDKYNEKMRKDYDRRVLSVRQSREKIAKEYQKQSDNQKKLPWWKKLFIDSTEDFYYTPILPNYPYYPGFSTPYLEPYKKPKYEDFLNWCLEKDKENLP